MFYTTDFDKQKNQQEAEQQAGELIRSLFPHTQIIHTEYDTKYQSYDVDFIASTLKIDDIWRDALFEVKNCSKINETGNLFIELKHYDYPKTPGLTKMGWYYKTKADYIMYRNHTNQAFVWFRLEDLREYIDNHCLKTCEAIDYKYYEEEDGKITKVQHKKTKGYLVPLFDFTSYCYDNGKMIYFLNQVGESIYSGDYIQARNYYSPKERAI